jgi:hypothetical protein
MPRRMTGKSYPSQILCFCRMHTSPGLCFACRTCITHMKEALLRSRMFVIEHVLPGVTDKRADAQMSM